MNPRFSWKQKAILVYIQIAALTWERVITLHWDKKKIKHLWKPLRKSQLLNMVFTIFLYKIYCLFYTWGSPYLPPIELMYIVSK